MRENGRALVSASGGFGYDSATMSDQPESGQANQPDPNNEKKKFIDAKGETLAWSAISTLVAGPAVWGGIGWLIDQWAGTRPAFTAVGAMVGFITSFYLVIRKFGRD